MSLYVTKFYKTDSVELKYINIKYVRLDFFSPLFYAVTYHDLNVHVTYTYNNTVRIMTTFKCIDTIKFMMNVIKVRRLSKLT